MISQLDRVHGLTWQMSTQVSLSRAGLATAIAENYKTILSELGEDTNREGLKESKKVKLNFSQQKIFRL